MCSASSLMKSTFDTYSSTEILQTLDSMLTKEMFMVVQDESMLLMGKGGMVKQKEFGIKLHSRVSYKEKFPAIQAVHSGRYCWKVLQDCLFLPGFKIRSGTSDSRTSECDERCLLFMDIFQQQK